MLTVYSARAKNATALKDVVQMKALFLLLPGKAEYTTKTIKCSVDFATEILNYLSAAANYVTDKNLQNVISIIQLNF